MVTDENRVGILGMGMYVPEKVITNQELESMVDTSDEWIIQRTGIKERRITAANEDAYTVGRDAAKRALENAGIQGSEIGLIIVTTATAGYYSPAIASSIQDDIGAKDCAAFDMNAACTGFIYGLITAEKFILSGTCKYALVIAAETLSKFVDWNDRATCILFGDGAGAAVLGRVDSGFGISASLLQSDGSGRDMITIPGNSISPLDIERRGGKKSKTIWMDGGKVLKFASRVMTSSIEELLLATGLDLADIDMIIPHQANMRIIENAIKRFSLDREKVFINLHKYGNTSSASVPIAMTEAMTTGKLKRGDNVILVAFGGGLTYGAALLKWSC